MENKLDHTSPLYCIACHSILRKQYLGAIETHHYGNTVHGYFTHTPSCAIPLSLDQAERLKELISKDVPVEWLRIEPVPWERHKEDQK